MSEAFEKAIDKAGKVLNRATYCIITENEGVEAFSALGDIRELLTALVAENARLKEEIAQSNRRNKSWMNRLDEARRECEEYEAAIIKHGFSVPCDDEFASAFRRAYDRAPKEGGKTT